MARRNIDLFLPEDSLLPIGFCQGYGWLVVAGFKCHDMLSLGGQSRKYEQLFQNRGLVNRARGLTLIEVMVALAIFFIMGLAIYEVISRLTRLNMVSAQRVIATAIANETVEMMRNLDYSDVGTIGGLPNGVVPQTNIITRQNITFSVATTIRNIDDPFDGTISGNPAPVDSAPADYKQAEVVVTCTSCQYPSAVRLVTTIAPNGLEIGTGNGALFVRVIDALAQPLSGASVHITNSSVSPVVDLTDTTNAAGELQLVDVLPSVNGYHIEVTKSGYSSDGTLAATVDNPNPTKPDATVAAGEVTQITFAIDALSTISLTTSNTICTPLGGVAAHLAGSKLIGSIPDILKYDENTVSDGGGQINRTLEWDTYSTTITDPNYTLIGTVGTLPINLLPNSHQDISLILGSPTAHGLHITVKDATTLLPISGATVNVTRPGFNQSADTGRGYLRQTDWSGGAGQENFSDESKYQSDDGQVDITTVGQVSLAQNGGDYYASGVITSSTFDTGGPTNFTNISWAPVSQPPAVGADSIKFQIASNNDNATWNFIGPDGTDATYYTVSNETINSAHNNSRYLRYKVFLSTADVAATPILSDAAVSFTSGCVPPGQVFFSGLGSDNYDVDVHVSGYDADSHSVSVNGWTNDEVLLTPS